MIKEKIIYTGTVEDLTQKYGFSKMGYKQMYATYKKHGTTELRVNMENRQLHINGLTNKIVGKVLSMASDLKYVEYDNIDEQIKAKEKELEELRAKKNGK